MLGRQRRPDVRRGWDLGPSISLREPGVCERLVFRLMYAGRCSMLGRQRRPNVHSRWRLESRCAVRRRYHVCQWGVHGQLRRRTNSLLGQLRAELWSRWDVGGAPGVYQPGLRRWRVFWLVHAGSYPVCRQRCADLRRHGYLGHCKRLHRACVRERRLHRRLRTRYNPMLQQRCSDLRREGYLGSGKGMLEPGMRPRRVRRCLHPRRDDVHWQCCPDLRSHRHLGDGQGLRR